MINRTHFAYLVLTLTAHTAVASTLGTVGGSVTGTSQYRGPGQLSGCSYYGGTSDGCGYQTFGHLPQNSSGGLPWKDVVNSFSATISSSVDESGLHAKAALSVINDPVDVAGTTYWGSNPSTGSAGASWTDVISIIGTPGQTFLMAFLFDIDGTLSATDHASAKAKVQWSAYNQTSKENYTDTWEYSTLPSSLPLPSGPIEAPLMYVKSGDSISIILSLLATASVGCNSYFEGAHLCTASAVADLSNTLKFSGIYFWDEEGNPLNSVSISSPNFNYKQFIHTETPTPEPGTVTVMALGLVGLVFGKRKLRTNA